MVDNLTYEQRSYAMSKVRAKDTSPEMLVRKMVHGLGYRYRLHAKKLPGTPDLVFTSKMKVIFVNGCFWHGHSCKSGNNKPKSNEVYWKQKLEGNRERDETNKSELRKKGWKVLTIWECQTRNLQLLQNELVNFLN